MERFIIYILAYVISGCIFGFVASYIASSKGYDGGFAWGFWLGIIGILVVGFRPTIIQTTSSESIPMYTPSMHKPHSQWKCGCGAKNPDSLDYCQSCHRKRGEFKPVPKVVCPHCGAMNKATNSSCFACGKSPSSEKSEIADAVEIADDPVSLLEKLAKFHEQGILTDEEFQKKKSKLLTKI